MSWQEAGVAWGDRARDWADLMEPLFAPVYDCLARALDLGTGTDVLDMGCGAGLALRTYEAAGAGVAGVDASEALLAIAKQRVPSADLHHASMAALPWDDGCFGAVTGVNSFVYADDGALVEAHRVLRPGGLLGLGYWRDPRDFGWALGALGAALAPYRSTDEAHTPLLMADAAATKALLDAAGFDIVESGDVDCVSEFPDAELGYRALASTGMIHPLVQANEEESLRVTSMEALRKLEDPTSGIRMAANFGWLTARRR